MENSQSSVRNSNIRRENIIQIKELASILKVRKRTEKTTPKEIQGIKII